MLQAIKYADGQLEILDQLLLPRETKYISIHNVKDGWTAINTMQVRGAPAIAIVGCLSLAVEVNRKNFSSKYEMKNEINEKLSYLVTARPTAVNIKLAADMLNELAANLESDSTVSCKTMKSRILSAIETMLTDDVRDNKAIGDYGAAEILSNVSTNEKINVLTHCNTGSLATAGYGTALGVIRSLYQLNRLERAFCTETRPYNQGARLTAYELVHDKIPATLLVDSMVSALMSNKKISAVVVGADRVAANGDTANKIGTYQIAVVAKYHCVPFYIAAPLTTIDLKTTCGRDIAIEERPAHELTEIAGKRIAAPGIDCWNPSFDVTPAELITAIITDRGVFKPDEIKKAFS